ncbi:MAG: right-handed parallel beta-helix repeat-containing protein [Kiritimatiellae bacterium]|nr:right-handed parallel beta-helix repeat-containing protein [Kiritimatiellia bacterium]
MMDLKVPVVKALAGFALCLSAASAVGAQGGIPVVKVDFAALAGRIKPVNGVGQPPIQGYTGYGMFHYLKEAGIPYSRLHDVGGAFGKNIFVDIPSLFRDFDADETDPKNYDFAFTDLMLEQLVANGVEPYFRLGVTIENRADVRAYRVLPPKDYAKWARICEHVVRHYTEGWAGGYKWKISHWEIWNEADGHETPETNCMWRAPFSEYCRFYDVAAKHLKAKFSHLMIGGYAGCGFYAVTKTRHHVQNTGRYSHLFQCFHDFVAYVREHRSPLDFFSFHCYDDPVNAGKQNEYVRRYLDANGFEKTELSLNEWMPFTAIQQTGSARQAALIAAMVAVMQNGPIDDAAIYDAKCGPGVYSPFFDPATRKPRRAYWVYYAFNELRQLKNAVRVEGCPSGVYAVAADDGEGTGAIFLANTSRAARPVAFDFGGREAVSCRVVDETRMYEEADLPGMLPADSVWRIVVKRKGPAKARPDLVAKVAAGELGYARVSWFGYDAADSTRFLKAALESRARRIIVDRMDEGPWITCPLAVGSEKDVVFENGAVVEAKRGEFRQPTAALFGISGASRVTMRGRGILRMHRDDYMKPPYSRAEWRHGISALSVNGLVLEDLTVEETGGDGLYLGVVRSDPKPCRDVLVRNCDFARNARQGISVISADGLTIENTVMRDTKGMPPEAGIDFEPNAPAEVLKNCVLRNCTFANNQGIGAEIYLATFKASSEPVDIRFENCRMDGNRRSFTYSLGAGSTAFPYDDGRVVLENCVLARGREGAVSIRRRKFATGETVFRNCRIVDACTECPTNSDVVVRVLGMCGAGPDGVRFENVSVRQPCERPWLRVLGEAEYVGQPTVISGEVKVISPARRVREVFDAARHAAEFPYRAAKPLPAYREFEAAAAVVRDLRPGEMASCDPICVRGVISSAFVFYADAAREVRLRGLLRKIGNRQTTRFPMAIRALDEKARLASVPIPGFGEFDFVFKAPAAGFYSIDVNTAANGFAIVASDAPVALDVRQDVARLVGSFGKVYAPVPANREISLFVSGDQHRELCGLVVRDAAGAVQYSNTEIADAVRVALPAEKAARVRAFELVKPTKFVCEDMSLGISGVQGFLFLSPEKYWESP